MIASKIKETEELKLAERFNNIYAKLYLPDNLDLTKDELFLEYKKYIEENKETDTTYILNIDGFIFQNEDEKNFDDMALDFLQQEIYKKEKQHG